MRINDKKKADQKKKKKNQSILSDAVMNMI